ncbi:MAG: NAD-dependent epimerase/dehydratase family protein [Burkholderiaceae bacterium]
MILVTGAGGHLGANLVRRLVADGQPVRALLHTERDEASVAGLPVESMTGDLQNPAFAASAVRGCRQVYHCAAKVSTTYRDKGAIFGANVLATKTLLRAAQAAEVEKVVVTGSFSATGARPDAASTEDDPFNPLEMHLPYGFTKAAVEHECLKAFADGLPVVVAVSTAILGPHDYKPSRMGRVLIRFAAGRIHAYVPGGFPFVAARDIVQGHILAMEKGRPGQKYIFETAFVTFDDLMRLFALVTGRRLPPLRIPPRLMLLVATVAGAIQPYVRPDAEQLLTPAAIRILAMNRRADIGKAKAELGFQPTSIEAAVREAYDWFVARGGIVSPGHRSGRTVEVTP